MRNQPNALKHSQVLLKSKGKPDLGHSKITISKHSYSG